MRNPDRGPSEDSYVKRLSCIVALFVLAALPQNLSSQITQREYAQRRVALAAKLPESAVLVVLGAREPAHDYEEFNQSLGMHYLTGVLEPEASLVMVKRGESLTQTLFVQPRDPAAETWTGKRMGMDGARQLTGLSSRATQELRPMLDSLAATKIPFQFIGNFTQPHENDARTLDDQFVAALLKRSGLATVGYANDELDQLRGTKSAAEMELIRKSVEITVEAQRNAMLTVRPDAYEYEVEAAIESTFRRNGAERPSFATIVGSGPNSTVLHYGINDRQMKAGEVVVMDIGSSYKGYSADVTRTVPVSGTFSPESRQVYQIVRDAQAAAERQAKPGATAQTMSDSASAVLAAGLTRLGLIESPTATYEAAPGRMARQLGLFYMHGLGHGIGLEVHDPEQYYFTSTMGLGSAFSIEPGIYVRANVLETLPDTPRNRELRTKLGAAVAKYANIGVRIEDDYIITDKGFEWISRAPREINEIEALMRSRRPVP
jgi:Xaa-Pro aminopeptidase